MFGISWKVADLLADHEVSSALSAGGIEMQRGIMQRLIDYDKRYQIKRISRSKDERAILSLYVFSKELDERSYLGLRNAVKSYATRKGVNANFAKVDSSLRRSGGQLFWNP